MFISYLLGDVPQSALRPDHASLSHIWKNVKIWGGVIMKSNFLP